VEGRENIPGKGRMIIASNHESYFDFIQMRINSFYLAHFVFVYQLEFNNIILREPIKNSMKEIEKLLNYAKEHGLYPDLRLIEGSATPEVIIDGQKGFNVFF